MALLTLNSTYEVGGGLQSCLLNIETDGLVVEGHGKLPWAGATMSIEPDESGCRITINSTGDVESRFFVLADSFGGSEGVKEFAAWLEAGVCGSGTTINSPAGT